MFYLFRCGCHCIDTLRRNQENMIDTIDTFGDDMREYIQHEAQSRAPMGLLGHIKRAYSRWQMRKVLRKLNQLSDHQLHDIGLTRLELTWLIAQPRDCDLRWEMGRLTVDPDAAVDLAGSNQQSGTPNRGAKWKSESPA